MGKKIEFTVEKQDSAITALRMAVSGLTRAKADLLIKSGEVRVNGVRVKTNATLSCGDKVCVFVPDAVKPNAVDLDIVYDDENIVVFNKPKRMAYDALPEHYGKPLFAVHRLDTNTTGLIVFAKTSAALAELSDAFRERRVKKVYMAVVRPAPEKDADTLTAYTKLMPSQSLALVSDKQLRGYKTMVTEYRVEERFGDAALLRVFPHTGRTHQIRAHFGFIGCPIIGEHKYGDKNGTKLAGEPESQMLAAVELSFSGLKNGLQYLNGKVFSCDSGFDMGFLGKSDR